MSAFESIAGETPLDDISGLLPPEVRTRARLNEVEAENMEALTKYLGGKADAGLAPFDLRWCYQLHAEMFGRVWIWAGQKRTVPLNLGVPPYRIDSDVQTLLDDLRTGNSTARFRLLNRRRTSTTGQSPSTPS